VVVIVLVGILGLVTVNIVGGFVGGALQGMERVERATAGRLAIERIARELRSGVPNSFYVCGGGCDHTDGSSGERIAFLRTELVGRYDGLVPDDPDQDPFDVLAPTLSGYIGNPPGVQGLVAPHSALDIWADPAGSTPRARLDSIVPNGSTAIYDVDRGGGGELFDVHSPQKRIYFAEQLVAFCKEGDKAYLARQDLGGDHAPANDPPCPPASPQEYRLLNGVQTLEFSLLEGKGTYERLVGIELVMEPGSVGGEKLSFVQQVRIPNLP
jgi:hypothetical protein